MRDASALARFVRCCPRRIQVAQKLSRHPLGGPSSTFPPNVVGLRRDALQRSPREALRRTADGFVTRRRGLRGLARSDLYQVTVLRNRIFVTPWRGTDALSGEVPKDHLQGARLRHLR